MGMRSKSIPHSRKEQWYGRSNVWLSSDNQAKDFGQRLRNVKENENEIKGAMEVRS